MSAARFDKQALYQSFVAALPGHLRHDRYFKIFYSHITTAQLAIVGLNPGGNPSDTEDPESASKLYERGEHDYVDCGYRLATVMRRRLIEARVVESVDALRRIPKINVIFHRSETIDDLGGAGEALRMAGPFVLQILEAVSPEVVISEGFDTVSRLAKQQGWKAEIVREHVPSRLREFSLTGPSWKPSVRVLALAHPSSARVRWSDEEWQQVVVALRTELSQPKVPSRAAGPVVRKKAGRP